jgi:hypothetical protein
MTLPRKFQHISLPMDSELEPILCYARTTAETPGSPGFQPLAATGGQTLPENSTKPETEAGD